MSKRFPGVKCFKGIVAPTFLGWDQHGLRCSLFWASLQSFEGTHPSPQNPPRAWAWMDTVFRGQWVLSQLVCAVFVSTHFGWSLVACQFHGFFKGRSGPTSGRSPRTGCNRRRPQRARIPAEFRARIFRSSRCQRCLERKALKDYQRWVDSLAALAFDEASLKTASGRSTR